MNFQLDLACLPRACFFYGNKMVRGVGTGEASEASEASEAAASPEIRG